MKLEWGKDLDRFKSVTGEFDIICGSDIVYPLLLMNYHPLRWIEIDIDIEGYLIADLIHCYLYRYIYNSLTLPPIDRNTFSIYISFFLLVM